MRSELLVGTTGRPAEVHGVHGAAGLTSWTCFARRAGLDGTWEAVEWASVPPGGVSGEHRHTRTEEIYFILSGQAEMHLDGVPHPVAAGDLVLTTVGTRHALHNVGAEPVDWLVIEMLSPHTAWVLEETGTPSPEGGRVESIVVNLREAGQFDPRGVFAGPLELVRIERLEPGAALELAAQGREHTVFVMSGAGTGTGGGGAEVDLRPGTSVTVPHGGLLRVTAGPNGIELFRATMAVAPRRAS